MYRNKKISVCLPCRNEAAHLHEVVKRIPKFVDEIIVISNKSTDNTVEIAKKIGVKVIEENSTKKGIGYGFAHIAGIKEAKGDIIVGADGDATYPLENLAEILDHFLDRKLDFVSCSRYPLQKGTKIPFKLRLGVGVLNVETRLLYGKKINDILSGMWAFKKDIADDLRLTEGDWNLSPQIKINAMTNPAIQFSEYSIAQRERMGTSHQAHYKTGFSHLLWILKNRVVTAKSSFSYFILLRSKNSAKPQ